MKLFLFILMAAFIVPSVFGTVTPSNNRKYLPPKLTSSTRTIRNVTKYDNITNTTTQHKVIYQSRSWVRHEDKSHQLNVAPRQNYERINETNGTMVEDPGNPAIATTNQRCGDADQDLQDTCPFLIMPDKLCIHTTCTKTDFDENYNVCCIF
jgi:hypothetical protein